MNFNCILPDPGLVLEAGLLVRENDTGFTPLYVDLVAIFVREDKFFLGAQELFVLVKLGPVFEVIEDGVIGFVIPLVEGKHAVEVHVSAEGPGPGRFSCSRWSHKYKRSRSVQV